MRDGWIALRKSAGSSCIMNSSLAVVKNADRRGASFIHARTLGFLRERRGDDETTWKEKSSDFSLISRCTLFKCVFNAKAAARTV